MRSQNDKLIISPVSVSGTWYSEPIWLGQSLFYSIQLVFRNSTATVKLQCSNDKGNPQNQVPNNYNVQNWTDIDYSDVPMNGDGTGTYDVNEVSYRWARIVITGNADLDSVVLSGKGV